MTTANISSAPGSHPARRTRPVLRYHGGKYPKCWKREGEDCWYLCWYQPHPTPGKIGIGYRIILEVDSAQPQPEAKARTGLETAHRNPVSTHGNS